MKFLFKYWRTLQRATDMDTLWPACKQHAEDLDHAKAAFYFHASNDTAWTKDYTKEELINFVDQLR